MAESPRNGSAARDSSAGAENNGLRARRQTAFAYGEVRRYGFNKSTPQHTALAYQTRTECASRFLVHRRQLFRAVRTYRQGAPGAQDACERLTTCRTTSRLEFRFVRVDRRRGYACGVPARAKPPSCHRAGARAPPFPIYSISGHPSTSSSQRRVLGPGGGGGISNFDSIDATAAAARLGRRALERRAAKPCIAGEPVREAESPMRAACTWTLRMDMKQSC